MNTDKKCRFDLISELLEDYEITCSNKGYGKHSNLHESFIHAKDFFGDMLQDEYGSVIMIYRPNHGALNWYRLSKLCCSDCKNNFSKHKLRIERIKNDSTTSC